MLLHRVALYNYTLFYYMCYFVTGLNCLQSGLHKQHMKDLFVELCLTVPVRLSSLLPYLPMLMDPLVSALNGSQTLVSQVCSVTFIYGLYQGKSKNIVCLTLDINRYTVCFTHVSFTLVSHQYKSIHY